MRTLFCKTFNQGNSTKVPLVLLHGLLGSSDDWQSVAQRLPKQLACYALDLPGHGRSADIAVAPQCGFFETAQLIRATLAERGIFRYQLAGYSLGGRIALYHATRQPEAIDSLLLESCHFGLSGADEKQQRLNNDRAWAARFVSEPLHDVLIDWYHQAVFNSLAQTVKTNLIEQRAKNDTRGIANMLVATSLGRQNLHIDQLSGKPFTTHYIVGVKDAKYSQLGKRYQRKCASLQLIKISEAGHNVHIEQPDYYARLITKISD